MEINACRPLNPNTVRVINRIFVHGIHLPPHDVERIRAADRVQAFLGHDISVPVRPIEADVGEPLVPAFPRRFQRVEKAPPRVPMHPTLAHTSRRVSWHTHHGQLLVPLLVVDLVDTDAFEPVKQIEIVACFLPDPADDRAGRAPRDAQQSCDGALGGDGW
ncbi:hypothetical protein [Glutamicibacter protophormiae]|uniref:Uncharacterized protein n=1 Tax=Glutamicibacter protophormiae TaxID=37930 RepID=A0ABS4XTZ2_GLUPR|nr:hypothetical protein [Glutamicibacter protophormiae]MBP2399800.1 hypothetical protein [Glutamicibacter protophormiae]GGL77538.1 hypothetical protein GCM10010038_04620 [Glutamicibacter protophormiae]